MIFHLQEKKKVQKGNLKIRLPLLNFEFRLLKDKTNDWTQ